jgi:transcriptional regulator
MHPARSFAWTDRSEMLELVRRVSFCTICVAAADGLRLVHAPVVAEGPGRLRFHVSRGNRAAASLDGARALVSCLGPDAYVSPDWYGTADQVPTWNYQSVEIEGPLRRLSNAELVDQLDALSAEHEARLAPKPQWTRAKMSPGRFEAMTGAIAGYELTIEEIRGTNKLGQNKRLAERQGAVAGLRAAGAGKMAELMAAAAEGAA